MSVFTRSSDDAVTHAGAPPGWRLVSVRDSESLMGSWRYLFETAVAANPFFGPDYLYPLVRHMAADNDVKYATVFRKAYAGDDRLAALLPISEPGAPFMPVRAFSHPYIVGGTPLLDSANPEGATAELLEGLRAQYANTLLVVDNLRLEDAATQAIAEACRASGRPMSIFETAERAAIDTGDKKTDHGGAQSRSLRKRKAWLCKDGRVQFVHYCTSEPLFDHAVKEFLALEAAGWKRRAGTAIISNEQTMVFARDAFAATASHPAVRLDALRLHGRMIAASLHVLAPGYAASIKSAYDEAYAEYSPGLVLDAHIAEEFMEASWTDILDSVALPGHPLERIWLSRVRFGAMAIGLDPVMSQAEFSMRLNLERLQRSGRAFAKQVYRYLRPQKR